MYKLSGGETVIAHVSRIAIVPALLAACVAMLPGVSCAPKPPDIVPLDVLMAGEGRVGVRLSPDGARIAYLAALNGVRNVFVQEIAGGAARPATRETGMPIKGYVWAMNGRQILYVHDRSGMDNWRLYGVDVTTGETRDYTPRDGLKIEIIGLDKRYPDQIVIAMSGAREPSPDAYRLDLSTGELTLAAKNPGNAIRAIVDARLFVRGAVTAREDGGIDFLVRSDASSPWRAVRSWSFEETDTSGPLLFSADGSSVYCYDAGGANTTRLVRLSLVDSSVTVIAEDPEFDVSMTVFDNDTAEPRLVSFDRERTDWVALVEKDRQALQDIRSVDPEAELNFVGSDTANTRWLVALVHDDGPNAYYLYERSTRKATFLFDHQPSLRKYALARMEPVTIGARDGMQLHAYLSTPPGVKRSKLPLVLRVHTGPWYRDYWGFWPETQWLANRGYAVLQVNYRGSRGYGKRFLNAGNKEWGGAMQDDLVDAVRWAVDAGIADPKRIGIMGAGYGGFAALSALTSTPELFACGVSISGIADLAAYVRSFSTAQGAYVTMLHMRIGDPVADAAMLADRSPVNRLDRIAAPLLLVQGGRDRHVPREHAERIAAALKAKGIPYEYLYFPDEGQGISNGANTMQYYRAADRFLARHLGGRCEETSGR